MDSETGTDLHEPRPGYLASKDEQLIRLRRVEGQIRGLQRMVAQEAYCIDILTQVTAATKALEAVSLGLVEDHLRHCLAGAAGDPQAVQDKVTEASAAIARLVRS